MLCIQLFGGGFHSEYLLSLKTRLALEKFYRWEGQKQFKTWVFCSIINLVWGVNQEEETERVNVRIQQSKK